MAKEDLHLLGCTTADTASEIKLAYRLQARRLQRKLLEDWPGANEQLALVNAAYDRLTSSGQSANDPRPVPEPECEIAFSDTVLERLKQALEVQKFKLRFEMSRDPQTGTYGDPRRSAARTRQVIPALIHGVSIKLRGGILELYLSEQPRVGTNVIAVPEITTGPDNVAMIGEGSAVVKFSLSRTGRRTNIDFARLPFTLKNVTSCQLVYQSK